LKGKTNASEISLKAQHTPATPVATATSVGNAPGAQSPGPNVTPFPKAEINFDEARMRQNLHEAISKLNDMMVAGGRGLNFAVDEKLGRPIISVKNSETGEVVRQIPNEVVVRIAHGIEDLKGLLHNKSS
jgi:flagellar protein FlaG